MTNDLEIYYLNKIEELSAQLKTALEELDLLWERQRITEDKSNE